MEKTYQPHDIEKTWYAHWENSGYFKPTGQGKPYCIMIPPPNVTGSLHMGHGFQYSLMDALIRYHRMCGFNTLWQVGTDHAGIATQILVERQLMQQGKSRLDVGRENFVKAVYAWKEESGNRITQQIRRMGAAVDWTRERFTMDPGLSEAVQTVFIKLYEDNLIYRGQRLVNWDPKLKTAISDLEVTTQPEAGQLWHIRYPLLKGDGHVVVATTRPETLFGDVAVAVHPDDPRYQHLIGEKVRLPLTDRIMTIIADEFVLTDFGSGCVKITPAHDFNDYEVGLRHQLKPINIFNPDATLNDEVPFAYRELDRYQARDKVIADLKQLDLIEHISPYTREVPRCERTGEVVEPYLTYQWFVKAKPLAEKAIEVVENNRVQFIPDNWKNTYFQWMHHIQDWCVSRQLWWGHRIPAWYDMHGHVYVGPDETAIRKKYQLPETLALSQEEDVLDTWFSSALWPFSTLGWPEETATLHTFYPTAVLVTGFDIIFFWVARMIMMGLYCLKEIPFHHIYITGLIRDHDGQKMSKSKGNILDPLDLIDGIDLESLVQKRTSNMMLPAMAKSIEQATRKQFPQGIPAYGTDALRFTFCALASTGRDVRFDLGRIEGYRNFCNKLWNAARFVFMQVESETIAPDTAMTYSTADRFIRARLQQVIEEVHRHFQQYRFDLLANCLYEFIWNEFCDWYLELSKPVLMGDSDPALKQGTRYTLVQTLETLLRLIHPLMPFISEAIWQTAAKILQLPGDSILCQSYPISAPTQIDEAALAEITWLKNIIVAIRTLRAEMQIAPSKKIKLLLQAGDAFDKTQMTQQTVSLSALAKIDTIQWLSPEETIHDAATAIVNQLKLFVPFGDLIDKTAEIARLNKEIEKLHREIERVKTKLDNPNYVAKAPANIVEKERLKLSDTQQQVEKLSQQLALFR